MYGLEPAAVMEASEAEWPKVEAGLGTVNDIGHDIADDGPEPEDRKSTRLNSSH